MSYRAALMFAPVFLFACGGSLGGVGDPCESEADCEDGLECHLHDGEMECEEPHDDDTDHTDEGHTDEGHDGHDHG